MCKARPPVPARPAGAVARRRAALALALAPGLLVCDLGRADSQHARLPDRPPAAVAPAPGAADDFQREVLVLVNLQREAAGLAPWRPDAALARIAAERSLELAQAGTLSHGGFEAAFARSGRPACVENLALGLRQPATLVAAWQASPAHRRNLVAPGLSDAGVALVAGYATLLACR